MAPTPLDRKTINISGNIVIATGRSEAGREAPVAPAIGPALAESEIQKLLRAVCFAFVCVVLFISSFRNILASLLDGRQLPAVSHFVFGNETLLLILSLLLPITGIATLFWKTSANPQDHVPRPLGPLRPFPSFNSKSPNPREHKTHKKKRKHTKQNSVRYHPGIALKHSNNR